ncbi:MFS general substrate transporter [Aspergillus ellipticus CBS 707.79]|uniref:MFS general substrate transporter n=1 Tax=Aspergillus ellipticus CBS 707.79 TaxID=1448320 RepID=A0A319D0X4_9EURO|nr:MFS general substrate transporter [Aspergillus ellipticus CBS 707.79]
MWDIIRDSAVGSCLRIGTSRKWAQYPEERSDFEIPTHWATSSDSQVLEKSNGDAHSSSNTEAGEDKDRVIIVAWYSDNDPDNPHNWSFGKKLWVAMLLFVYTFSVYIGSSLYTSSEPDITRLLGVSDIVASLGLTMYVIGYGIGPMIFSPLSEIPVIGRTAPYILTYIIFVILCVPMALVNNLAGILILRFLLGFFGSPCLATAGASYGDFYGPVEMPYVIALWGGGATLGPALGPLVGGFAVQATNWHWSSWELLWLSGPTLIFMFLSMPETSSDNILLRRAQRLRAQTGRNDLWSESEIRQSKLDARQITFNALIKPWEINALDPAVLFSTFYTGLTYAIYYSFFESFPLVYNDIYNFNLGQLGLAFLAVLVGLSVAVAILCAYLHFIAPQQLGKYEIVPPEARLWPGLFATFLIPIGLYIFAWTARASIHWIVSLVGVGISMCGVFIITQCMFIYLPFTYPRYAGSLFAANGLARSLLAGASILFSRPMFEGIKVSGGVTLLASFSVLCIFGMFALYFGGAALRQRSRFAGM